MRIYRGSDADIVLRPFMVRLSEIVSFDLQLWTSGAYVIKRSTTESGMTTDKENNLINVHLTDKETSYLDAGVLNAKMMYRITDSEYPDGTYDGIITIPQEYYMMTPPDYSGGTVGDIYESGYTEGYNTAIQNSVLSINGEKGDLNLKTINGNGLLGEGDIKIEGGGGSTGSDNIIVLDGLTQEERKAVYEKIDQTKLPTFRYGGATSIYTYTTNWMPEPRAIEFYVLRAESSGMHLVLEVLHPDGDISEQGKPQNYANSLFINVDNHVNDNADFECYYTGDLDYIKSSATRPNSYFIFFSNGIGDSTKPVFAPVSVIWDNNNFDGNSPFRIQFIANDKLYTYLHGDDVGKWLFESAKSITGGGSSGGDIPTKVSQLENDSKFINQSSQSSTYNIEHMWVGNQSQYDALETKDARTLFIII